MSNSSIPFLIVTSVVLLIILGFSVYFVIKYLVHNWNTLKLSDRIVAVSFCAGLCLCALLIIVFCIIVILF